MFFHEAWNRMRVVAAAAANKEQQTSFREGEDDEREEKRCEWKQMVAASASQPDRHNNKHPEMQKKKTKTPLKNANRSGDTWIRFIFFLQNTQKVQRNKEGTTTTRNMPSIKKT